MFIIMIRKKNRFDKNKGEKLDSRKSRYFENIFQNEHCKINKIW